jgi:Archaeal ATPase.
MSKAQENNNNSISANNSEQDSNSDPFHFYSSKIKPIYIPIVGLKERKSDNECSDHLFIGRKRLISKLKGWLEDNSKNGVYLISGYRGMGKTSFVNKVLKDINCNNFYPENKFALKFINSLAYWTLFIFYLYFFSAIFLNKLIPSYDNIKLSSLLKEVISPNILSTIFWIFVLIIFTFTIIFFTFTLIIYITTSYKISNKRVKREKKSRIAIKLNLGSEVLKERDILALISKMLHEKYAGYKSKFYYSHPYIGIFSLFIKAIFMYYHYLF